MSPLALWNDLLEQEVKNGEDAEQSIICVFGYSERVPISAQSVVVDSLQSGNKLCFVRDKTS